MRRRSRPAPRDVAARASWLLAIFAMLGCSQPATRVLIRVVVDAEGEVRDQAVDIEVRVELRRAGSAAWDSLQAQHYESDAPWPITLRVPSRSESSDATYQLIAIVRDARGAVLVQARALTSVKVAERDGLHVLLEAACLDRTELCGPGLTCAGGDCVSARYDSGAAQADSTRAVRADAAQKEPEPATPSASSLAAEGEACADEGERRCAGFGSVIPLLCEGGKWQRQPECTAAQHCDSSTGPQRGQCRAIARECIGQSADVPFCSEGVMHVCNADLLGSDRRPCAENEQCVMGDQAGAVCGCRVGFVNGGAGCLPSTDCTLKNGGCDALTTCRVSGGVRSCTACPTGFGGTGETGCVPKLVDLGVSPYELHPAFEPDVDLYRVRVPLLTRTVTLSARAPENTKLTVNGAAVDGGAPWVTPPLSVGPNEVELILTTRSGATKAYRVVVERQGAEDAYIKASHVSDNQLFGWRVAASGDTLVVAAPQDDSGAKGANGDPADNTAPDSGAVYVFVRRDGVWRQQAYLKPSNTTAQDVFAEAVAISGDTLVVGAVRQDPVQFNLANPPNRYGSVYVFTRSGDDWTQQAELTPSSGNLGDRFGSSLLLAGDETLMIGAVTDGPLGRVVGAVYVYTRTGSKWTEQQKLKPSQVSDAGQFGSSLSLSGDTLVVGAMEDGTSVARGGSAFIFTRRGEVWTEQQKIDPRIEKGEFGFAVALLGDTLAVGAPHITGADSEDHAPGEIRVFERTNERFVETAVLSSPLPERHDCFGSAIGLAEGLLVATGLNENGSSPGIGGDFTVRGTGHSGAAYLFVRTTQGWKQTTYIKANNPVVDARFGTSLALTDDMLAISASTESNSASGINPTKRDEAAPGAGAVYVFR